MRCKHTILTVGLPGSGKSTYSDKYALEHPGCQVLHADDWFINNWTINGAFARGFSPFTIFNFLERHFVDVARYHKETLIIDFFLPLSLHRDQLVFLLRFYGVEKVSCWNFITPDETALKRSLARMGTGQGYLFELEARQKTMEELWQELHQDFEPIEPFVDLLVFDEIIDIDTT